MKPPRKTATPAIPPGIARAFYDLAKQKLEQDSLDFLCGTSEEDPKHYALRIAAAREALGLLHELAGMAGIVEGRVEPTEEETLAAARRAIANENRT